MKRTSNKHSLRMKEAGRLRNIRQDYQVGLWGHLVKRTHQERLSIPIAIIILLLPLTECHIIIIIMPANITPTIQITQIKTSTTNILRQLSIREPHPMHLTVEVENKEVVRVIKMKGTTTIANLWVDLLVIIQILLLHKVNTIKVGEEKESIWEEKEDRQVVTHTTAIITITSIGREERPRFRSTRKIFSRLRSLSCPTLLQGSAKILKISIMLACLKLTLAEFTILTLPPLLPSKTCHFTTKITQQTMEVNIIPFPIIKLVACKCPYPHLLTFKHPGCPRSTICPIIKLIWWTQARSYYPLCAKTTIPAKTRKIECSL